MTPSMVILLTGVLCAVACSLLGTFLILRRMAMMTDAISHAILPGLVAGYVIAGGSNLLVGAAGAAGAAMLTVTLVEALRRTGRLDGGASIGIVFPAMFALGTVLVTRYFAGVHLDTDAILYGNIEFAFFERLYLGGHDLGPQSLWVMGGLVAANLTFLLLFFKELKLTTFDAGLAAAMGFSPLVLHYALMLVLSFTTVGAFTAVGAILVVALVIVPAATAYLLTERLIAMVAGSAAIGAGSAISGYWLAIRIDGSVAGAIVTMTGVCFGLALLFSPSSGLVSRARQHRQNRRRFTLDLLIAHLGSRERSGQPGSGATAAQLGAALRWPASQVRSTVARGIAEGMLTQAERGVRLSPTGRAAVDGMRRT